jgi:hypothetical protein
MRRRVIGIACAAVALGGLSGTASASPSASASCVGIITSAEATQLPAGSVGQEVSGLGRSVPRLGEALVSPLAREHGGNCA